MHQKLFKINKKESSAGAGLDSSKAASNESGLSLNQLLLFDQSELNNQTYKLN